MDMEKLLCLARITYPALDWCIVKDVDLHGVGYKPFVFHGHEYGFDIYEPHRDTEQGKEQRLKLKDTVVELLDSLQIWNWLTCYEKKKDYDRFVNLCWSILRTHKH